MSRPGAGSLLRFNQQLAAPLPKRGGPAVLVDTGLGQICSRVEVLPSMVF